MEPKRVRCKFCGKSIKFKRHTNGIRISFCAKRCRTRENTLKWLVKKKAELREKNAYR